MDVVDDLFEDWNVTYVEPGSGLSKLMRAPARLKLSGEGEKGRVHVRLAESGPGYDERVDWSCECEHAELSGVRISLLKGRFSQEHDAHEHEVTIVCMHFPRGGRCKGRMMGYVRHEDPAIPHLTGAWHAEH
jgi:hypothetical protein